MVEHSYPQTVPIVDWSQAASSLKPIAKLTFPNDLAAPPPWLENMRTNLWEGTLARVIAACQKAVTYYTNNQ